MIVKPLLGYLFDIGGSRNFRLLFLTTVLVLMAALFLLDGKAHRSVGPLLGVAAIGGSIEDRKKRVLELKGMIRSNEDKIQEIFRNTEREFNEKKRPALVETVEETKRAAELRREQDGWIEEHDNLELMMRERSERSGGVPGHNPAGEAAGRGSFLSDPLMREWLKSPKISDDQPWSSPVVNLERSLLPTRRDLVSVGSLPVASGDLASAGALIQPRFEPGVDILFGRPLNVLDLISRGQTGSPLVRFYRGTFSSGAGMTGEASGVADGSGAAGQSSISLEPVDARVKNCTSWIPLTNDSLEDVPFLQGELEGDLDLAILMKAEDQIIGGDGVGNNFLGILNHTGGETIDQISLQAFDTDILSTARKAITKVQVNGLTSPTAYVVSPTISEAIDLEKNNQGNFYSAAVGAPWNGGPKTLWGYPIVTSLSPAVATYGIVADWRRAKLWDRMGQSSSVYFANQHADFAIRFMTAMIGVYRGAFGVKRPPAFCRIAWSS
jgi:HK97 family phage major capsid protein